MAQQSTPTRRFRCGRFNSLFIGCPFAADGASFWAPGLGPQSQQTGAQVFSTVLESGATVTDDTANAVAVDTQGSAYVVGTSTGNLYTTANAYQGTNAAAKRIYREGNVDGTAFDYASYLGCDLPWQEEGRQGLR